MFNLIGAKLLAAAHTVKKFVKGKEEGASMVEYAILLGLITAAVIGIILLLGDKISSSFDAVNSVW